jgi:hypothetical protein
MKIFPIIFLFILVVIVVVTVVSFTDNNKNTYPQGLQSLVTTLSNLSITNDTVLLTNSDFANGTYRIRTSGNYVLQENIVFEPTGPMYTDTQYGLGFFAAITVETKNVIIDLNGFEISQGDKHYMQQRFFSVIELASSPFIPKQGPFNFGASIDSADTVMIKNGKIGKTSHHSIHGNGNANIYLYNLVVYDFEIAGIALNGCEKLIIENVQIGPNLKNVVATSKLSHAHFMIPIFEKQHNSNKITLRWKDGSYKTVSGTEIFNILMDMDINHQNYEELENKSMVADGNVYGLVINRMGVAVNAIPLKTAIGARHSSDVYIHNITVRDISSKPHEVLAFSKLFGSGFSYGFPVQKGPVGDVFRIQIDENGKFVGDWISAAHLWLATYTTLTTIDSSTVIWTNSEQTLHEFLDTSAFLNMVSGGDSMSHFMKGNIGVFLIDVDNITCNNMTVKNIDNQADESNSNPTSFSVFGGSSHGLLQTVCRGVSHVDVNISNISSASGASSEKTIY